MKSMVMSKQPIVPSPGYQPYRDRREVTIAVDHLGSHGFVVMRTVWDWWLYGTEPEQGEWLPGSFGDIGYEWPEPVAVYEGEAVHADADLGVLDSRIRRVSQPYNYNDVREPGPRWAATLHPDLKDLYVAHHDAVQDAAHLTQLFAEDPYGTFNAMPPESRRALMKYLPDGYQTQLGVSELTGIQHTSVSRWMTGRRSIQNGNETGRILIAALHQAACMTFFARDQELATAVWRCEGQPHRDVLKSKSLAFTQWWHASLFTNQYFLNEWREDDNPDKDSEPAELYRFHPAWDTLPFEPEYVPDDIPNTLGIDWMLVGAKEDTT